MDKFLKTFAPDAAEQIFKLQLSEYEVIPVPDSVIYGPMMLRRHAWLNEATKQTQHVSWLFPNIWTPAPARDQSGFADPTYPYKHEAHEMTYAPYPFLGEFSRAVTKTFWLGRFDCNACRLAITEPMLATQIMFACYANSEETANHLYSCHPQNHLKFESPCIRIKRPSEIRTCLVDRTNDAHVYCKYFVFDLPLEDREWQLHLLDMSVGRANYNRVLLLEWQQYTGLCNERRRELKQLDFVASSLGLKFCFELDSTKAYLFKKTDYDGQDQPQPELAVAFFDLHSHSLSSVLDYLANYHVN